MKKNVFFYLFLIAIITQISCKSTKDIAMFQDVKNHEYFKRTFSNEPPKYRIKVFDNLYLSVKTLDPDVNNVYNPSQGSGSESSSTNQMYGSGVGQYINGYRVSEDSTVSLPVIGEINLVGLTLEEAEERVKKRAEEYLQAPSVQVKLLNFRVNILGEVNSPGFVYNYEGSMNIIEAIGSAADITVYADLKNVVVNRQIDNITHSYKVDLTTNDIYNSDVFYLQPNDILYIPPTKLIRRNENVSNYSIFLGTLSTILLLFSFFN